jgi:integrase/recombinase XerD
MAKTGYNAVRWLRERTAEKRGGQPGEDDRLERNHASGLAVLSDEWLEHLKLLHYAEKTISVHTWSIRAFLRWAQERDLFRPEQITKPILESYQRHLYHHRKADGEALSVRTQRARLSTLQQFFAWLCRANRLGANPASELELPRKKPRPLPRALSPDQIQAILSVPDIADPLGLRDRAILELFYSTGIRRAELVRLDHENLDPERGILAIRQGKGGKDRTVPVGARALAWLRKYLDDVRPLLLHQVGEHALFLSGYGERLSANYLGNWVRRTIQRAGVEANGACHLFRHSCATHMLENGADIRHIQQLLGHACLDTTAIYTDVTILQLQAVHARCHPSGQAERT